VIDRAKNSRFKPTLVALGLVLIAASCVSSDGATFQPEGDRSQVTTSSEPTAVSGVDEGFLAENIARVDLPADGGSVMVVVVEPDGTMTYASAGTGPGGTPPTVEDVFRIGSITKVFTSIATLTLIDDGLVDLDAAVANYVTRLDVPAEITVRDLLQHTSGLPNFTSHSTFYARMVDDPRRAFEPEETFALVAGDELLFDPGSQFEYSNSNYLVLGVLIEEVTGRPAADELRSRIIDPIEMTDTYLSGFEPGSEPFGSFTTLYGSKQPIDFDYTSIESDAWTAGAMVSSAGDLHKLFTALVGGDLVSNASFIAMTSDDAYGFGLITSGGASDSLIGHDGGIVGYSTLVFHSPETGRTAFWVAAGDGIDYSPAVADVAARIAR
jgi:D-alanyl-D-alanine carboxypeptidase